MFTSLDVKKVLLKLFFLKKCWLNKIKSFFLHISTFIIFRKICALKYLMPWYLMIVYSGRKKKYEKTFKIVTKTRWDFWTNIQNYIRSHFHQITMGFRQLARSAWSSVRRDSFLVCLKFFLHWILKPEIDWPILNLSAHCHFTNHKNCLLLQITTVLESRNNLESHVFSSLEKKYWIWN